MRKSTDIHVTVLGYFRSGGELRGELLNAPSSVTQWRRKVEQEVRRNDIPGYENAILSMIWIESNGNTTNGPDIMNAGEATGREISSLINPLKEASHILPNCCKKPLKIS